jgi:hypothetical protein
MLISTDPMRLSDVAPHLPEGLTRAVERAMVRDPEKRWPSLDPFISAVRECFPEVGARVSVGGADAPPDSSAAERAAYVARDPAMVATAADSARQRSATISWL